MADFQGGRGKKVSYQTQMYRIPSPLRPIVEMLGLEFRLLWDGEADPRADKLISRIKVAIEDRGKNQISDKCHQQELDIKIKKLDIENAQLRSQLDDMGAKAGYWHERAKAAESELEQSRSAYDAPQAIALLKKALELKANAGGAIKEKIRQALALISSQE